MPVFKRRKPEEPPAPDSAPDSSRDPQPPRPDPAARAPDSGLGVPPRPVAPPVMAKDAQAMSRPPFPAPGSALGTPPPPAAAPAMSGQRPTAARPPAERRTLVVGRGISVQGTITDAERLVVEGIVEATMIHATELMVAQGGMFRGETQVEDAEVAGTIDGVVTARGNLIIRATGRVIGTARCRRLQVEDGGQISGQMEMITEPRPADQPARAPDPAA